MFLERLARALQEPVTMWPSTVWREEREKRSVTGNFVQKSVTGKTSSWEIGINSQDELEELELEELELEEQELEEQELEEQELEEQELEEV